MDLGHGLGLSALTQGNATVLRRVPLLLHPSPFFFLDDFCWCSFVGTLTSWAFAHAIMVECKVSSFTAINKLVFSNYDGLPIIRSTIPMFNHTQNLVLTYLCLHCTFERVCVRARQSLIVQLCTSLADF
jgi:hypothetical protein